MKETVKTSRTAGYLEKIFRKLNEHYFLGNWKSLLSRFNQRLGLSGTSPWVRRGFGGRRTVTN